ncbi:MAG: hypothetical protein ACK5LC_17820 [Coprobacillaceae bacterium]
MGIINKINSLLELNNENISTYAKFTNRSQPNISNKIKRNSWTAKDLILLAELTNTTLMFIDDKGNQIILDKDDIEE